MNGMRIYGMFRIIISLEKMVTQGLLTRMERRICMQEISFKVEENEL